MAEVAAGLLARVAGHSRFAGALAKPGPSGSGARLPPIAARLQAPLESLLPVVEDECWAQQVCPPRHEGVFMGSGVRGRG